MNSSSTVTLDCDGHTVTGDSVGGNAITVAPGTVGVVVRNCVVDVGRIVVAAGQRAAETAPRVLGNSTLENHPLVNGFSLRVEGGGGNTIVGNTAVGYVFDHWNPGFDLWSDDNTLRDNVTTDFVLAGFYLGEHADRNFFIGNSAYESSVGFLIERPSCCTPERLIRRPRWRPVHRRRRTVLRDLRRPHQDSRSHHRLQPTGRQPLLPRRPNDQRTIRSVRSSSLDSSMSHDPARWVG